MLHYNRYIDMLKDLSNKKIWIPQIITILMLLWGMNTGNSYSYYILLRWVCCAVFAYLAFQAFDQGKKGWVWILGFTAILYNPFFRIHLTREVWTLVNLATIAVAFATILFLQSNESLDT